MTFFKSIKSSFSSKSASKAETPVSYGSTDNKTTVDSSDKDSIISNSTTINADATPKANTAKPFEVSAMALAISRS
ncbi:hypothetical protein BGZ83_000232 [Gryganskiella cystojenkinii]|nr:hypothetical protein BGZ83_000232 [Gryganskiella cystojenkinii]